jgi:hypothetical protein
VATANFKRNRAEICVAVPPVHRNAALTLAKYMKVPVGIVAEMAGKSVLLPREWCDQVLTLPNRIRQPLSLAM